MNIAELKREKTIKTLARRLLAESSKDTSKTSQSEMEAALLRLNPHLNQIGTLARGTPIAVPDGFALADKESAVPMRAITAQLLEQAERALTSLRATLQEHVAQATAKSDRAHSWLSSDQAKEYAGGSSDLKRIFTSAAPAAKALPKEQSAAVSAQDKALEKVASELAAFRRSA